MKEFKFNTSDYRQICVMGDWIKEQSAQVSSQVQFIAKQLEEGASDQVAIEKLAIVMGAQISSMLEVSKLPAKDGIQLLIAANAHAILMLTYARGHGSN